MKLIYNYPSTGAQTYYHFASNGRVICHVCDNTLCPLHRNHDHRRTGSHSQMAGRGRKTMSDIVLVLVGFSGLSTGCRVFLGIRKCPLPHLKHQQERMRFAPALIWLR